jgi:hypothetical protein
MTRHSKAADKSRKKRAAAPERQFKRAFVPGTAWTAGRARRYFGVADPVTDIAFLAIAVTLALSAAVAAL